MAETEILYKKTNKETLLVQATTEKNENFIKSIGGEVYKKSDEFGWILPAVKENDIKKYNNKLKTFNINDKVLVIKSRKTQRKYRRAVSESEDSSSDSEDVNSPNSKDGSCEDNKYSPKNDKISEPEIKDSESNTIQLRLKKTIKKSPKSKKRSRDNHRKNIELINKINVNLESKDTRKLSPMEKDLIDKIKLEQKIKFEKEKEEYEKNNPVLYYKTFNNKPIDFKKINKHDSSSEEDYSSSSVASSSSGSFPSPRTPKKRKKYFQKEEDSYNNLFNEMKVLQRQLYEMQIENKKLKSKNLK